MNRLFKKVLSFAAAAAIALTATFTAPKEFSGNIISHAEYIAPVTATTDATEIVTPIAVPSPEGLITTKLDLTNESIQYLTNLKSSINSSKTKYKYFYNFNTKMSTGLTGDDWLVPIETDLYGIIAEITGKNKISVKVYNNSNKKVTLTGSYVENCTTSDTGTYLKNRLALNRSVTINASTLNEFNKRPKIWRFVANLKIDNTKTQTVYLYFCTNIDETKLCMLSNTAYSTSTIKAIKKCRANLIKQFEIDKINPKNETGVIGTIYYPWYDFGEPNKYRCDTKLWSDKAKTIVNDKMSDELKVWTFYNWLTDNIAYDYYKYKKADSNGQGFSRACMNNDYSGKWNVYNTKTGVCMDYANIMAIFCRTYNIPAVVVSNTSHAWSAVYLNGRWIEIDCTQTNKYAVKTIDVNNRVRDTSTIGHTYDFDPTRTGEIKSVTYDPINEYLCNDKIYVR